jgi:hypothetical protein
MDGIYLSNTYDLIRNKGYQAVLIEGDRNKYKLLCQNVPQQTAIKICRFVTLGGPSSLDSILQGTPIPLDFDFLSIDIDGCDYHIFESLKLYKPKIICIEFNPSIPNEIEFVQPADFAVKQGSSAKSIVQLGARKGYVLAATTVCNLVLVREDFKGEVLGAGPSTLELLRDDAKWRTFVFFGYDGTVLTNRESISIPWHRLTVRPRQMQFIPRYLRKFGEDYSLLQKISFALFVLIRFPGDFRALFREKILDKFLKRPRN